MRNVVDLQPLHAVPLDRGCYVMNRGCAIRKAHVNDVSDRRVWRRIAPEKIGSVKIVVRPERLKERKKFSQSIVQRKKSLLCFPQPIAFGEVAIQRGTRLKIASEFGPRVFARKYLEAGHQGCRLARGRIVASGSGVQSGKGASRIARMAHAQKRCPGLRRLIQVQALAS